jgi:phosphoribosylanthranilate isomerase
MNVRVKICGITDKDDALMCVRHGVDALGFIFYKKSSRCVMPRQARAVITALPALVSKVGVFVDEKKEVVEEIAAATGIDTLQFHGKESPAYCRYFLRRYKVVKAFFPRDTSVSEEMKRYQVDGYLLDLPLEDKAENPDLTLDLAFVNDILREFDRCIFSGGITPDNIGDILSVIRPYAIDLARGVEDLPGKKDEMKVKELMKRVNGL